ncbi:ABC transporter ATP-binding protein [Desulfofundulus sp. TPOSR]|uniref:ABC transporter ATP-binding protein n=1 Tax=Desulfofundulus sp. TPOSR TaxID=2714340 RepID=UPI001407E84A|nr:ABC transporter ATP-binding protein [Desulfofundulus sp. TPOSR]NHM28763.1 ABC transporter ATP-binding protein [Desulfofundulus sp. TPOSR]
MGRANRQSKVQVDVTHRFGNLLVLDKIKFAIYENEFLCIVGPSGSGKTTLANLIAGLLKPSEGAVTVGGEPVDPGKHNIAYVFQARSCLPWRTVWENIKISLEVKNETGQDVSKKVQGMIDLVGLKGFENYYPHQISGGMKQRVAIARAFCIDNSDLLILDEPFGSLDAQTRYLMQQEVLKLWEQLRRTVIYITNNIEEAVFLAERILVFSHAPARIIEEVYVDLPRPRNFTDARFLAIRKKISDLSDVSEDLTSGGVAV